MSVDRAQVITRLTRALASQSTWNAAAMELETAARHALPLLAAEGEARAQPLDAIEQARLPGWGTPGTVANSTVATPADSPQPVTPLCEHLWAVEAGYGPRGHGAVWCHTCGIDQPVTPQPDGLQEMERHRDDLIAACAVLRRMMENERKIADLEAQPPSMADTGVSPPPQKEEQ